MSVVVKKRAKWQAAERWLSLQTRGQGFTEASDKAREALGSLARGSELRALSSYSSSVDTLATLLSNECLDDELINMLMAHLDSRVRIDPELRKEVIVAPLAFQHALELAYRNNAYGDKAGPLLKRYKQLIVNNGRKKIVTTTHENKNHWIGFKIDFQARLIQYGETLMPYLLLIWSSLCRFCVK